MGERRNGRKAGFTLVELLVVMGIIAMLAGILLPVLSKARAAANTTACLANLRSLGQAMLLYANDYRGAIPGSANTTGRYFYDSRFNLRVGNGHIPPPAVQLHDFIGPLAEVMNLSLPQEEDQVTRFRAYRGLAVFQCPANSVEAPAWPGGVDAGTGRMLSYCTPLTFMLTEAYGQGHPLRGVTRKTCMSSGEGWWQVPGGYWPKINKVGPSTAKIYLADSGKWSTKDKDPDYNLNCDPFDGGAFSDYGAFTTETEGYDRTAANGGEGKDSRIWGFRHGSTSEKKPFGSYRLNAVFFDGHAETLDEAQATDPSLWLPSGTVIPNGSKVWPDVTEHHKLTYPYVVP